MSQQSHDGARSQQSRDSTRGRNPELGALLEGSSADESDGDESLSDDDVFEVLYNRRRRDVLRYMREHDGTATVGELAEYIAAKENDTTVQQLSSYERKRVYVGLYQNHLPMMDDVGVADYDKDRGTVELRESVEQLGPYLDGDVDAGTSRLRVGGTLVLASLLLLGILDVGMFAMGSDLLWTAIAVVGFLLLVISEEFDGFAN